MFFSVEKAEIIVTDSTVHHQTVLNLEFEDLNSNSGFAIGQLCRLGT